MKIKCPLCSEVFDSGFTLYEHFIKTGADTKNEYTKLLEKIHEFLDTVEKRRQENTGDSYDPKEAASQEWEIQMLKSLLENEK